MSRRKKPRPQDQNGNVAEDNSDDCNCKSDDGPGCFVVFLICFMMWGGCQAVKYIEKRTQDDHEIELKKLEIEHLKLKGEAK